MVIICRDDYTYSVPQKQSDAILSATLTLKPLWSIGVPFVRNNPFVPPAPFAVL